ncbi:MAG: hypothetical protein K9K40_04985 [Desulfotignum sp.]|nr:hypothetical protein [Desulfotignum sp.]
MWLDTEIAVIGRGLRTNQAAIDQITTLLAEMGITTLAFDLPFGTMHFMGIHCIPVPVDELQKANGALGCMTGILHRKM